MAIKFSQLCFLLFQILGLVHMVSTTGLTVQVSEHGRDEQSCLHNRYPCKTLTYALWLIEKANLSYASSVIVNVTSNQTIKTTHTYNFSSSLVRNVTVIGCNKSFLSFQDVGSFQIMHTPSSSNLKSENSVFFWTWIDLGFASICPQDATCDKPTLKHNGLCNDTVNFFQCKFISIGLNIAGIQDITFNSSVFGSTGLCPSVCINNPENFDDNEGTGTIKLSYNDFQNCVLSSKSLCILDITNARHTSTIIVNNTWHGLMFNKTSVYSQTAIGIKGAPILLTLQKNFFEHNRLAFAVINVQLTSMSIQNNTFQYNQNNRAPTQCTIDHDWQSIINIITNSNSIYNRPLIINVLQNNFKCNANSLFFMQVVIERMSNAALFIRIINLLAVNNSGISELIAIKNANYLRQEICIEMEHLQLEENDVHLYSLVQSMKSSVIHLININKVTLADSSFRENFGTPVLFEFEQVLDIFQEFCALGNIVFQENSGFFGGALSLHGVKFNITCEGNLLFEKNEGDYGGALYLENIKAGRFLLPNENCRITLNFLGNSARTAGNSIYYASPNGWELEEGCLMTQATGLYERDIRTAARFIANLENKTSVFPGQTIIFNGTVADYFGHPSSCLASAFIHCNTSRYKNCFNLPINLFGPDKIVLTQTSTRDFSVNTNLVVQSPIHSISLMIFH